MIHLIGAGGHGKVVAEIFLRYGHALRVLDRSPERRGERLLGMPIDDEETVLEQLDAPADFFVALGAGAERRDTVGRWEARGHRLVSAVHPAATLSPTASVEAGACVMAGSVLQADCRVGKGAIVNTGATVDHDCSLGSYSHVAPGTHFAGNVAVSDLAWVGLGSSVREGIRIGARALIGAGSVVVRDIPEDVVAFGNPCRVVRPTA